MAHIFVRFLPFQKDFLNIVQRCNTADDKVFPSENEYREPFLNTFAFPRPEEMFNLTPFLKKKCCLKPLK